MNYAIIDGTTVKSTGTIQELFPNTSFPPTGPDASFLADNNVVELISTLSYTPPTQKLTTVDAYIDGGKVYNVKVESTTTDEQTTLINSKWEDIRRYRDSYLIDTDWRASTDLTLSDDWKNYRQALRDIPTQSDPFNITWPTKPS
tara:strand:+ start:273 stop:707 length:435 start_codon:yes stop_codon:yes gene_type:complete